MVEFSMLPVLPYQNLEPVLQRSESTSRSGRMLMNVVEYADPAWSVDVITAPLARDQARMLKAWVNGRRGALRSVLYRAHGYDGPKNHKRQTLPRAHIDAISGGNILTLDRALGLELVMGDYVSIVHASGLHIGQLIGANATQMEIEPRLPTGYSPIGGYVILDRIQCTMRIVPDSFEEQDVDGKAATSISFQMVQVMHAVNVNEAL